MRYVELYLIHKNFPVGQQRVCVVQEGRVWVHLFSPFNLATGKLPTERTRKSQTGETWPETYAKDVTDVPLVKIARRARKRYRDDRRMVREAAENHASCGVIANDRRAKKIKALIEQLEKAAEQ